MFVILCQDALLFTISHLHVFPKSLIQGFKSTLAASSVLACCFELEATLVYFLVLCGNINCKKEKSYFPNHLYKESTKNLYWVCNENGSFVNIRIFFHK